MEWIPIDHENLPEEKVFAAVFSKFSSEQEQNPTVFAYGDLTVEENDESTTPFVRCWIAWSGGSYVVDGVTHYIDPDSIPRPSDLE